VLEVCDDRGVLLTCEAAVACECTEPCAAAVANANSARLDTSVAPRIRCLAYIIDFLHAVRYEHRNVINAPLTVLDFGRHAPVTVVIRLTCSFGTPRDEARRSSLLCGVAF